MSDDPMQANSTAPVTVVIVSWNSARDLPGCLNSLRELRRPPAQIIVVDSGSTDESVGIVREGFPEVALLPQPDNVGFCRGNNLGIAAATQPFVLALNPDTELDPDFLEELLPAFEDPRVGLAAGKLLRMDRVTLDSAGQELAWSRKPLDRGYNRPDRGQFDRDGFTFGACGAAALYRRTMLDSIVDPGPQWFDETFFAFYEDLDLAWRARKLGWRCGYRYRAVGLHLRGATAERQGALTRSVASLGRRPEIRFHILKNRFLTLVRNETVAGYLVHLPFIWARDLGMILLVLLSPGSLPRFRELRRLIRGARQRRRLDACRPRHQV